MRPEDERYFAEIEAELDDAFEVANEARRRGDDPEPEVEIPVARDMADRVENILGIDGVAERVRELEGEMSREEAALELVEDFVEGAVGDYETRAGKVEGAVRTAVALLTEGVVAAPIEGIDRVELLQNDDGTEFINVYYAGPIRSAGGTAQALSVLVADYARALLDIDEYHARSEEIGRYAQEVALYDDETGLQYAPSETEAEFIAEHMPIMLDGEATGDEEVSGYRDLDRVDTNAARGGMCLVLGEGIALKAPKIQRYTRELDEVSWPWLQDLIDGTYKGKESHDDQPPENDGDSTGDESSGGDTGNESSGGDTGDESNGGDAGDQSNGGDADEGDDRINDDEEESDDGRVEDGPPRPDSSKKYLQDLIAGRPVFSHPSETGGFRLRYGRSRNHGHATAGVHPATMRLVDDFLAAGTQIKTERPGKAAGVVPVDTIEGPTVRLANGDVRRIDDESEALELRNGVERVLDLGEYLVNYGEFVENNHPLAPASYVFEWWIQEFEAAGAPVQAMRDSASTDLADPTPAEALEWATIHDAPLHPAYTYLWHDVSVDQVVALARAIDEADVVAADGQSRHPPETRDEHGEAHTGSDRDRGGDDRLVLQRTEPVREALEALLVEHTQDDDWLSVPCWRPLVRTLGFDDSLERSWRVDGVSEAARGYADGENAIRAVNEIAPFAVRERAPTRIGNRMGRPEKSEQRELSPAVHTLFPIGDAGGNQRSVETATEYGDELDGTRGDVSVEVGRRDCVDCGTRTYRPRCPSCGGVAEAVYVCPDCDREVAVDESGRAECDRCGALASPTREATIDVGDELKRALDAVGERTAAFDSLKGVKGLSSAEKTPEPLEKGILRAKHDVSAFKDGTIRYDMTDLPVTAVRPAELDVTAERFRELGYETDVRGDPLRHDDQLVELRVQDVVLSEGAAEHLLRTAEFVDDLLSQYYGLEPYYEFDERDDLVGELVFGMAPHTSAATVGRIVGFTTAAVGYAHPYFHAAKRRNCFHPETEIWYEDEAGARHHEPIGGVVESYLDTESAETDDFGTIVDPLEHLDGTLHVPSLDDDGTQSRQPIEALSKHPAPDHLVRIETRSGRELEVTPDHEVHVHDPDRDRLVPVAAGQLDEGDRLVTPAHLESFETADTTHGEGVDPADSTRQFDLLDFVPADVTLGMEGDRAGVDRMVSIDRRVATLLGYYAAEGAVRKGETPSEESHLITFSETDAEAQEFLLAVLEAEFGVDPSVENDAAVTASGAFFDSVLDAGTLAHTKRVPQCIFDAPDPIVEAYLGGYVSGNGTIHRASPRISATTVSHELRSDLLALLTRLGITARVRRREPGPHHESGPESHGSYSRPGYELSISGSDATALARRIGPHVPQNDDRLQDIAGSVTSGSVGDDSAYAFDGGSDDYLLDPVEQVAYEEAAVDHVYCLTVSETHALVAEDLSTSQCDGDEDCVMLLLDGMLNFSKQYLPDKRGGKMDAPLVMSSRIDPTEIDDEAHNVDIMTEYPREFYEATRELADPEEVEDVMRIAEETLGTDREYTEFRHTHDTADVAAGPDLSAYKTLGSMEEKMDAQLALSRRIRAVDETDVAERIIEYHFLPDLLGNLKAFARQDVRCLGCGEKYRRAPLSGDCRHCGGDVTLTVHEGSVNKYMDTAIRIAEEFDTRDYTKQRLEILERRIDRLFEDDTNRSSTLAEFM